MNNQIHTLYLDTILDVLPPKLVFDYINKGLMYKQVFHKNELIHLEGDVCSQIEVIIEGRIVIERIGMAGDLMTINHFKKGDIIGANLIFSSTECYPMTITSKTYCQVIIIPKKVLFELCNTYPEFLLSFIKIISDLSVLIGTKMKNRISRTIRQSLLIYINRQYQLQNSKTIGLTMSKKALSEMFGVNRTSLSRELQKMAEEGLITYDAKSIKVLDINILNNSL